MISDDSARKLHDRLSRGEALSVEEQTQLENWYASQDTAERKILGVTASEKTVASLQSQVYAALSQLTIVTKRIQEVSSENETLRNEIGGLRRQLIQLLGTQAA